MAFIERSVRTNSLEVGQGSVQNGNFIERAALLVRRARSQLASSIAQQVIDKAYSIRAFPSGIPQAYTFAVLNVFPRGLNSLPSQGEHKMKTSVANNYVGRRTVAI